MGFIVVLILTTLAIAGSAAFFSIYGLAQIFSGAFFAVVIMASSLEAGKLVAASYVYRYWTKIGKLMRGYLIASILVLMMITSAGIFGFLSQAHIASNASLTETNSKVTLLEEDKARVEKLKEERLARRKQIDDQVANLPSDYVKSRQKLMASNNAERKRIDTEIVQYDAQVDTISKQLSDLKLTKLKEESHVGPILFIAQAMGKDVNTAITWMIMLIMFAFDPLAVVLTIGVNVALKVKKEDEELPKEVYDEPDPSVTDVTQIQNTLEEEEAEVSPEVEIHKQALRDMLKKKEVKERIRNPDGQ